ncbi:unnamed protein product [Ilex paraguariensis]|uniref:Uncharacterized protein n=1 Tax=Ilex paraguariensis TaxID=185542 RepID=A0ABC8UML5_9AQUA
MKYSPLNPPPSFLLLLPSPPLSLLSPKRAQKLQSRSPQPTPPCTAAISALSCKKTPTLSTTMAATAASDVTDGPVLSFINKRIRGLRKKYNRIVQMEESIAQAAIDELEKLRQPLSSVVVEEVNLAIQRHQVSTAQPTETKDPEENNTNNDLESQYDLVVDDLLKLLYFGSMFDVKSQNDFTATMLTKIHERGCCLTYDYVTDDDANDLLGERDLDLISMLGGFLISRPVDSSLSHKNALQRCIEHAKLWLSKSDQPIGANSAVTYAQLREKLNKIMASDYFTTTPEMKAPVEVAAAASGNYGSFQVHESVVPVQVEGSVGHYQQEVKTRFTCDN